MTTAKSPAGRKRKPFVTPDKFQRTIDGLRQRESDRRWVVIETGEMFTEPDWRLAVARYERTKRQDQAVDITVPLSHAIDDVPHHRCKGVLPFMDTMSKLLAKTADTGVDITGDFNRPPSEWLLKLTTHEPTLWAWVREQIIIRPQYVADQTGIEQIAYLDRLEAPEALPSFKTMAETWNTHATCGKDQRKKVLSAWEDFVATSKIGNLRDITPEIVVAYQDDVHGRIVKQRGGSTGPISGKQQSHLFTGIKTLLRFIKGRGVAVKAITAALANLDILKPSKPAVKYDPKPIELADWQKLLSKAQGENKAMIMLALNGAYYLRELIYLNWSDINYRTGTITAHRKKTGQCVRVCVLWPETLEALKAVPRIDGVDSIFRNYAGKRLGISGAQMRFNELADLAKVPHVTASQLRDGASTAAAEANVSEKLCNVLMGHASGMSDHYVKRNPRMVKFACDAVRAAYLGKKSKRKAA